MARGLRLRDRHSGRRAPRGFGCQAARRAGSGCHATVAGTREFVREFCSGHLEWRGDIKGSGSVPLIVGQGALVLSVASAAMTTPDIFSDSPGELDWASWGINLALALLNILSSINFGEAGNALNLGGLSSGLESALGVAELLVLGLEWDPTYGEVPANALADAALGINMVAALPRVINPIKLFGELPATVVAVLDVVMGEQPDDHG